MLSLPLPVRIFLCTQPADMRKSFDGLAQMVREFLDSRPALGTSLRLPLQARRPSQAALLGHGRPRHLVQASRRGDVSLSGCLGRRPRHRDPRCGPDHAARRRGLGERETAEALPPAGGRRSVTLPCHFFPNYFRFPAMKAALMRLIGMSTDTTSPSPPSQPAALPQPPSTPRPCPMIPPSSSK